MNRKNVAWLYQQLPELVDRGVLDDTAATRLRQHYGPLEKFGALQALIIFGALGGLLIGLGVILLLAHNWDSMSRLTRTSFVLLPLLAGPGDRRPCACEKDGLDRLARGLGDLPGADDRILDRHDQPDLSHGRLDRFVPAGLDVARLARGLPVTRLVSRRPLPHRADVLVRAMPKASPTRPRPSGCCWASSCRAWRWWAAPSPKARSATRCRACSASA